MERIITAAELEALKELPRHEPGVVTTLKLDQLPDYLALHGLKVTSMQGDLMLVKSEIETVPQRNLSQNQGETVS